MWLGGRGGSITAPAALPRARKRFGQHFLIDAEVVDAIMAALALRRGEAVLEIGPGHGVLTMPASAAGACVTALEIDRDLAAGLRRRLPAARILEADALAVDYADVLGQAPARVFGNLPYNISTPLLNRLFDACAAGAPVRDMHFMLQAEVAARLGATPGTRDWGRLSVIAQYHCEVAPMFDVPATAFAPPPKVSSTFLRLTPRPPPTPARSSLALRHVVRVAFAQRRKRLGNAVQSLRLDLAALGIDADVRPEALAVADFVAMANVVELGRGQR